MTIEQLEEAFDAEGLGVVYKGKKPCVLESEEGKKCQLKPNVVYDIVFMDINEGIAVLEVDPYNAVAIIITDETFEFIDYRPIGLPC